MLVITNDTLIAIGILLLVFIFALCICCCCCAIPILSLLKKMIFGNNKKSSSNSDSNATDIEYQMIDFSQHGDGTISSSSTSSFSAYQQVHPDIPVAEATYMAAPLAVHDVTVYHDEAEFNAAVQQSKSGSFKDLWAAVLFIINVVIIVTLAVNTAQQVSAPYASESKGVDAASDQFNSRALSVMMTACVSAAVLATVCGSLWLSCLINHSESLITNVLWSNIVLLGVLSITNLLGGSVWGALIFGVFCALSMCYYSAIKDRIPFASAVLTTACKGIESNYHALLSVSYALLFFQALWFVTWNTASYGVLNTLNFFADAGDTDDGNASGGGQQSLSGGQYGLLFLLFISFFWGAQLISAVLQTTVAGSIALWWFEPKRPAPVRGSLFRALSSSFGSLCLGSLLVSVIQALRAMLNSLRDSAMGRRHRGRDRNFLLECGLWIIDRLLLCIESALVYFNKYAFCYIAAYGLDFVSSGRQVTRLFTLRGMTAVVNDNLITRTLMFGVIFLSVLTGVLGALITYLISLNSPSAAHFEDDMNMSLSQAVFLGGLLSTILGVCVSVVLTNALESAVAMVFVCFAEDPFALQNNHYDEFVHLLSAWDHIYPEVVSWIFDRANNGSGGSGNGVGVGVGIGRSALTSSRLGSGAHKYPGTSSAAASAVISAVPVGTPIGARSSVPSASVAPPPPYNPSFNKSSLSGEERTYQHNRVAGNNHSVPPPFNPNFKQ